MKMFVMLTVLAAGMFMSTGCATPAYSSAERGRMILRNWDYEWKQVQDDVDYVLLLRPASRNTIWNVR